MGGQKAPTPPHLLPKISHTYPTMMKLGTVIPHLKKIQKIYESRDTPPDLCWHQHFFTGIQQTLLYQENRYRLYFSIEFLIILHFLESLKICLMNSYPKMATPSLLELTVFWNKGYDVIIFVDEVTNKILSRDSNYIVDVFMWPKFGNCSISMREVITTSIL